MRSKRGLIDILSIKKEILYFLFQLWLLMFIISLTSIAQDSTAQTLRIDPSSSKGGTVSQYIDSVKFFTFESTPESAFGNIDEVEITDKYFIILDRESKAILIFTKGGKLHAKIEGAKLYPRNPNAFNFNFDKKTKLIQIDYAESYLYFFDLNGKVVNKIKHIDPYKEFYGTKAILGDDYEAYYAYNPAIPFYPKDSVGGELMVFEKGKLKHLYMPYRFGQKDNGDHYWQGGLLHSDFYPAVSENDSTLYYLRNCDYNVYKFTPNTLQVAYRFIFPLQNSLPPNFRTDSSFNKKRSQYFKEHKEIITRVGRFYIVKDCIFYRAIYGDYTSLSYVYYTQTQNLVCINKIVSDSTSYFLPVTDAEVGGSDFINRGLIYFDGSSFYTSYSSLILFNQAEATENKKHNYPPKMAAYLSNEKNRKGNPVLVQILFKPNL